MCGIGGLIKLKNSTITEEQTKTILRKLLLALDSRGGDATGVAGIKLITRKDGSRAAEAGHLKSACDAKELIKHKDFESVVTGKHDAYFLHTRQMTTGEATNNNNNHPVIGKRSIVVHNGIIPEPCILDCYRNDGVTPLKNTQVDSAIIAVLHDKFDDAFEVAARLTGSYAYAVVNLSSGRIQLVRHSSPLILCLLRDVGAVVFASTVKMLDLALFSSKTVEGVFYDEDTDFADRLYLEMEDDTAINFNPVTMKLSQTDIAAKAYATQTTTFKNGVDVCSRYPFMDEPMTGKAATDLDWEMVIEDEVTNSLFEAAIDEAGGDLTSVVEEDGFWSQGIFTKWTHKQRRCVQKYMLALRKESAIKQLMPSAQFSGYYGDD